MYLSSELNIQVICLTLIVLGSPIPCECDENDYRWRRQTGHMILKDMFPILSLHFGDTGHSWEHANYTLGPLKCTG